MDHRLQQLLKIVVEEYVATAEPVGSQYLVDQHQLDVSPATVRNWFAELEDQGYLVQPHISGGRIPTEKGFRSYIEWFVQPKPALKRERVVLEKAVESPQGERMKNLAKALAELSGGATVISLGDANTFYTGLSQLFAQPEFQDLARVVSITDVLDHLDETLHHLRGQSSEPRALIGKESPFGPGSGMILASSNQAMIGIVGPLRMDYQSMMSLLSSAFTLLEE